MNCWRIVGGRVIDPANQVDGLRDLYVADGRICDYAPRISGLVDAVGCYVLPGLIDCHTHLRTPGQEYKEDLRSGSQAAARGGFTTVMCMPNTVPPLDSPTRCRALAERAEQEACVRVLPVGALTVGMKGEELCDFTALAQAGVVAVSDDGSPVQDDKVLREALVGAGDAGLAVILHCEDTTISRGAPVNQGAVSARLGVPGIPRVAEDWMVARAVVMLKETGASAHLTHLSTREAVGTVTFAKRAGLPVTCDVTPHHLLLDEDCVLELGSLAKVNPPLRTRDDREALIEAVHQNLVDCVGTDHAPHTAQEKALRLEKAPFGIVGLETAFPLLHTYLDVTPMALVGLFTSGPASVFRLADLGRLGEGAIADVVVFDPQREWTIDPAQFASKAKFSPFAGWKVRGAVMATFVAGRPVYVHPDFQSRLSPPLQEIAYSAASGRDSQ